MNNESAWAGVEENLHELVKRGDRLVPPGFVSVDFAKTACTYTTADVRKIWDDLVRAIPELSGRKRPLGQDQVALLIFDLMTMPFAGSVLRAIEKKNKLSHWIAEGLASEFYLHVEASVRKSTKGLSVSEMWRKLLESGAKNAGDRIIAKMAFIEAWTAKGNIDLFLTHITPDSADEVSMSRYRNDALALLKEVRSLETERNASTQSSAPNATRDKVAPKDPSVEHGDIHPAKIEAKITSIRTHIDSITVDTTDADLDSLVETIIELKDQIRVSRRKLGIEKRHRALEAVAELGNHLRALRETNGVPKLLDLNICADELQDDLLFLIASHVSEAVEMCMEIGSKADARTNALRSLEQIAFESQADALSNIQKLYSEISLAANNLNATLNCVAKLLYGSGRLGDEESQIALAQSESGSLPPDLNLSGAGKIYTSLSTNQPAETSPSHSEQAVSDREEIVTIADPIDDERIKSLTAISRLIAAAMPGCALAVARLHEETFFDELPDGASFYVLLCSAAAIREIEPPRYELLDEHFARVKTKIELSKLANHRQTLAAAYVAAALRPALFQPGMSYAFDLAAAKSAIGNPALTSLVETIQQPVIRGLVVRPETLRIAAQDTDARREQRLAARTPRAKQIIDNVDSETRHDLSSHPSGSQTWAFIRSTKHPVGQALHALALRESTSSNLWTALKMATDLFDKGLDAILDEAYKQFGADRLISANRQRLIDALEAIELFLRDSLMLLKPSNTTSPDRLSEFAGELQSSIAAALESLPDSAGIGPKELAFRELRLSLLQLSAELGGAVVTRSELPIDERLNRELRLAAIDLGIEIEGEGRSQYGVGREALLVGNRFELLDHLRSIAPFAIDADECARAASEHLDANRLLAALRSLDTLQALASGDERLADLRERYLLKRDGARRELALRVREAKTELARSSVANIVSDSERAQMEAGIEKISNLIHFLPLEGPVRDRSEINEPADIVQAGLNLNQNVFEPLFIRREDGVRVFLERLDESSLQVKPSLRVELARIKRLAEEGSLGSAEEYLSMVLSGRSLPKSVARNEYLSNFSKTFLVEASRHNKLGLCYQVACEALSGGDAGQLEIFGQIVDQGDRLAAENLLHVWSELFLCDKLNVKKKLSDFFDAFSLQPLFISAPEQHGAILVVDATDLDIAGAIGSDTFVVPDIGSRRRNQFSIAIITGKGDLSVVRQALQFQPHIIFCRARLGAAEREKLYTEIRKSARGALIVDDPLMVFASLEPNVALSRIVGVASSFLRSIPYENADSTSAEMFFGRQFVREQILSTRGIALIYGGRRLGKSSVINDICNKQTNREKRRFFVRVELKQMDNEGYVQEVWRRIGSALIDAKIIPPHIQVNIGGSGPIIKLIKEAFTSGKVAELMLFLDEADYFMRWEDAKEDGFPVVHDLSEEIINRFDGRFRVAIAGLNNVQRISQSWNTRLKRLGAPIALTPFIEDERQEGIRLITDPLAALGFEFEHPDLPLEILYITNFYPALIQVYCARLLENLYRRDPVGIAPFPITRADIQDTESDPSLQREMLEIFGITVGLDPKYKVICSVLSEAQAEGGGERAASLILGKLSDRAVELAPKLFPRNAQSTLVEAAAEELLSLGILVRSPDQTGYQFRSPSIQARLRDLPEIRDFLAKEGGSSGISKLDTGEERIAFGANYGLCPMPLRMINALCRLPDDEFPAQLLACSPAAGYDSLLRIGQDVGWTHSRVYVKSFRADSDVQVDSIRASLVKIPQSSSDFKRKSASLHRELFVVDGDWHQRLMYLTPDLARLMNSASRGLLLLCSAEKSWALSGKDLPIRLSYVPLWTRDAVELRLKELELAHKINGRQLDELLDQSGGCFSLVESAIRSLKMTGKIPTSKELLESVGVTWDIASAMNFFGVPIHYSGTLAQLALCTYARSELLDALRARGCGDDADKLLAHMQRMGAVVSDVDGGWGLNSILNNVFVDAA